MNYYLDLNGLKALIQKIVAADNDIKGIINGKNGAITGEGNVVNTISQSAALVTATKEYLANLELGAVSSTDATSAIAAQDTLKDALKKLENSIAGISSSLPQTRWYEGNYWLTETDIDGPVTFLHEGDGGPFQSIMRILDSGTRTNENNSSITGEGLASSWLNLKSLPDFVNPVNWPSSLTKGYWVAPSQTGAIMVDRQATDDDAQTLGYQVKLDVRVDDATIGKRAATGGGTELYSLLSLGYEAAVTTGENQHAARIVLYDDSNNVLSSVDASQILGSGIVSSSSYDASTGTLTVNFVGGTSASIDLTSLIDFNDVSVAAGSTDYLTVTGTTTEGSTQLQYGVKLATVTYDSTNKTLTISDTNGKLIGSDALSSMKSYVDAQIADKNVSASGDGVYISASAVNNAVSVSGTYGAFNTPTAASNSLSATTNGLAKAEDVATAVNAVVANLDGSATATAASGDVYSVLTSVTEADGVISKGGEVTLAAVAKTGKAKDVTLSDSYATAADAAAPAVGDTVSVAIGKLQKEIEGKQATGNYKTVQTAVADAATVTASDTDAVVTAVTQDTNGEITVVKNTVGAMLMTGYSAKSGAGTSDVQAADSVNAAIKKVEEKADANAAAIADIQTIVASWVGSAFDAAVANPSNPTWPTYPPANS